MRAPCNRNQLHHKISLIDPQFNVGIQLTLPYAYTTCSQTWAQKVKSFQMLMCTHGVDCCTVRMTNGVTLVWWPVPTRMWTLMATLPLPCPVCCSWPISRLRIFRASATWRPCKSSRMTPEPHEGLKLYLQVPVRGHA